MKYLKTESIEERRTRFDITLVEKRAGVRLGVPGPATHPSDEA